VFNKEEGDGTTDNVLVERLEQEKLKRIARAFSSMRAA